MKRLLIIAFSHKGGGAVYETGGVQSFWVKSSLS